MKEKPVCFVKLGSTRTKGRNSGADSDRDCSHHAGSSCQVRTLDFPRLSKGSEGPEERQVETGAERLYGARWWQGHAHTKSLAEVDVTTPYSPLTPQRSLVLRVF